jgi:DnaJ-domain-containing protein 1
MGSGIVETLARSQNWILDAVRFAAVWVALADHDFDAREAAALHAKLPDRPGGVPLDDITRLLTRAGNSVGAEVAHLFGDIRDRIADSSKETFLRLLVQIAAADGRISQGERHALIFVAELLDRADLAERLFRDETGLDLYDLADLSDPNYWRELEEASARSGAQSDADDEEDEDEEEDAGPAGGRGGGGSNADPARVEALATLGLVGSPSADEIKTAYRRLAKLHHPDRYAELGADAVAHATRTFQRIQGAYALLVR